MVDKERNLIWDNYKGLLIFLVVFAHFLYAHSVVYSSTIINKIVTFIYLFHMPAFIFCSGYFSVSNNSRSKKSIVKLLVYYLIFNTIMMVFMYFYNEKSFVLLSPYNSYWYLLSLVFWRLSIKYLDKIKWILPFSIIIALSVGFNKEFSNILSIKRTIVFFPFFLIGYKLAQSQVSTKLNLFLKSSKPLKRIISITILIVTSIIVVLIINKFHFTSTMLLIGAYKYKREVLYRLLILIIAFMMMFALLFICPNKYIPILTKAGRNSLGIYVFHRFVTYEFLKVFEITSFSKRLILYSFIATILCLVIFGMNSLNKWLNDKINDISCAVIDSSKKGKTFEVIVLVLFIIALLFKPMNSFISNRIHSNHNEKDVSLNISKTNYLSKDMQDKINDSIKISYVGDLILLKDQVTSAYNKETKEYDFNNIFTYTKKYFDSSDLSIGVFEGPTAGSKVPYSTSNYGDGIKLYLNFPDSFAKAVKDSGIDLVTTANNHLLDRGYEGATRTIDILDKYKIDHVGSYKSKTEKNNLHIVNVKGVKIAVLSYISAMNYYKLDEVYTKYPNLTSIIPRDNSKNYKKMYREIKEDFKRARESDADLIMVMPHMGTQFTHSTNEFQDKWNKIFSSLGADIILGDHAHAVQPIEYIGNTVVVNCPGNFANSYIKYDGDATAIVDLYIDKKDKKVIATDVVPMYTQEYKNGYFRALPIYDIINDKKLKDSMSTYEMHRVEKVLKIITKVMINRNISLKNIERSYYFINNNYYVETNFKNIVKKYKDKEIYKLINKSDNIVFIGDSITEGTMNNYHPYYEPLMDSFQNKKITNISKGSYTTKMILRDYKKQILLSKGELFVIAIGTNDIRYRNIKTCALTSEDYIMQISNIIKLIKKHNTNPSIVLIAPWLSLSDDNISRLSEKEKKNMMKKYSLELEKFSAKNHYLYINPNDYIEKEVSKDKDKYMVDFIHPNDGNGIKLYSEAVLHESK